MRNRVRPYAWGSRTAIAELLGEPTPAPHPQAELWIGAHPADSSVLLTSDPADGADRTEGADRVKGAGRPLVEVIAADPVGTMGARVYDRFGARLPFLLKVLAAAEPLSLQAHPSAAQAERGFALEEAAGIPLSSPQRNYRDSWPKPELICALTEFEALCGFREPSRTVHLLAALEVPALDHYLGLLSGQPDEHGTRALFSSIITIPPSTLGPLLADVLAACVQRVQRGDEFATEYRTALALGERYPGDPGVLASLLLNRITLQPGQALFLPGGNLHAYLAGVGIEIMANSDNVLRGGLTPKHVDVGELMKVLDFGPGEQPILHGDPGDTGEWVYRTPAPEFRLSRLQPGPDRREITHPGPQVLLVVDGSIEVSDGRGTVLVVPRGRSVWIGAQDGPVWVSGGGTAFRAIDGLR
ncbi:mannose-6-phosphate isomerase, class I [Nakamurella sp.]|uniref:mannose-6-phosphate isomerase, class I n=1 Tax=Nakamurella sp. TaxID=1869182 RepID=UPI00378418BE